MLLPNSGAFSAIMKSSFQKLACNAVVVASALGSQYGVYLNGTEIVILETWMEQKSSTDEFFEGTGYACHLHIAAIF